MKKLLGFAVSAAIIVGVGIYFMTKNPEIFDKVINWVTGKMGIN